MRPDGTADWKEAWRAMDRRSRERITLAIQRGEYLKDPREARLAAGLAERWRRQNRFFPLLIPATMVVYILMALSLALSITLVVGSSLLLGAVLSVVALPIWRMKNRRLERAESANRSRGWSS